MSKAKRRKSILNKANARASKSVSTKPLPWNGDHGPATQAARADTELVEIEGPNRMAHLRKKDRVRELIPVLTMRQHQAAQEIQNAYACNEMLSSGSPLKEKVDSTQRPDAAIAAQVDAVTRLERCTRPLAPSEMSLVRAVCWENSPRVYIDAVYGDWLNDFAASMDRVADALRY